MKDKNKTHGILLILLSKKITNLRMKNLILELKFMEVVILIKEPMLLQ
jgi:hypothetical protein